jgi:hypothetical protein
VNIIRKIHTKAYTKAHSKAQQSPTASWVALSIGFLALAVISLPN